METGSDCIFVVKKRKQEERGYRLVKAVEILGTGTVINTLIYTKFNRDMDREYFFIHLTFFYPRQCFDRAVGSKEVNTKVDTS